MHMYGYLRVSTDRQADSGPGLDAQRKAIRSETDRRGWTITWAVNDGYSARTMERPALRDALAQLRAGVAQGIVVAKLDRLSRSVVDLAGTLAIARKQGWAIVLLDLDVDTSTPNGKLVAGLMALIWAVAAYALPNTIISIYEIRRVPRNKVPDAVRAVSQMFGFRRPSQ